MSGKDLKILHLTDVHSGVRSIPNSTIFDGLETTLFGHAKYSDVDALVISGDFFDEGLQYDSEEAVLATRGIETILRWAVKYDVVVLAIRGTTSHDGRQIKWFEEINRLAKIGAKLYYFKELGVHYIKELDKTILVVPDEIATPRSRGDAMIKALLKEKNIVQVDFAITHAYFDFHLPAHKQEDGHQSSLFKEIVKSLTFNGHVHTPSLEEDVLTGGSWARTRHGEEERKGAHLVTIRPDNSYVVEFILNSHLVTFKTINVRGMSEENAIKKVEKVADKLENGNLRLHYNRKDSVSNLIRFFQQKYPNIIFSTKVEKMELVPSEKVKDLSAKFKGVTINRDNLNQLIVDQLKANGANQTEIDRTMNTFSSLQIH